jgi:hypothetical protein
MVDRPYQEARMITREYAYSANVAVKPISGKYSWTVHPTRERAIAEARSSQAARAVGRHTRGLYRVNVYFKVFH